MTDLPAPNIPLLRKAVEWAEAEAAKTDGTSLWDQTIWAGDTGCGTAYCVAGWTVYEAAGRQDVRVGPQVESEAQALVGLTDDESSDLFHPDNSIEDIRRIAEQIAARAGERL
jgi:nucleotide-binding universal stress UspA family protein